MKRFYWESVMHRIAYGTDAQVRQRCVVYDRLSGEPVADCWDVEIAEMIVRLFNEDVEKRAA